MLKTRLIPVLLLKDGCLVKTVKFKKYNYIGDPSNTVRIFNELEVDELILLDIVSSSNNYYQDFKLLKEISNECFMPLSYGGGIDSLEKAKRIFDIGYEKIILNTSAEKNPQLISEIASVYGSQAVILSIDVKKNFFGNYKVFTMSGKLKSNKNPIQWAQEAESLGAGEIIITSIDKEGTWQGFDIEIIKSISDSVSIPVIANGGAGSIEHISNAVKDTGVSAVSLGSIVVYQKKDSGVLINFPDKKKLEIALS